MIVYKVKKDGTRVQQADSNVMQVTFEFSTIVTKRNKTVVVPTLILRKYPECKKCAKLYKLTPGKSYILEEDRK